MLFYNHAFQNIPNFFFDKFDKGGNCVVQIFTGVQRKLSEGGTTRAGQRGRCSTLNTRARFRVYYTQSRLDASVDECVVSCLLLVKSSDT